MRLMPRQFSLRGLLAAVAVFGLIVAWGAERTKVDRWCGGHVRARYIPVGTLNEAEALAVQWLEQRGFTKVPDAGPLGLPFFAPGLDVPIHYFVKRHNRSCAALLFVRERETTLTVPTGKETLFVGYSAGYSRIWPSQRHSYQLRGNQLSSDFDQWFIHDLEALLSVQANEE